MFKGNGNSHHSVYCVMIASMAILTNEKTFRIPLACVELGEIPPVCKLKELNSLYCEASFFLIDTAWF